MLNISDGDGSSLSDFMIDDLVSSLIISVHKSTHSSQMNTVGPAISFLPSCWLLPQKEQ